MTPFELTYLTAEPFLSPLHRAVRSQLLAITKLYQYHPGLLDVGGRKSHYTIGLPANVMITDLPRKTGVQRNLNLGVTQDIAKQTLARRSNVRAIVINDMTQASLMDRSFECVVAVEVLEHVQEDALFVAEVHRVLKIGGVFLMTTPNGDFVKNTNPDHKRHYTRGHLQSLLSSKFTDLQVDYAVQGGMFHTLGLRSWSITKPRQTFLSMMGGFINAIQSSPEALKQQSHGTHHLVAVARKQD